MTDVLSPEQRRLNMSRIRGKNTRPEMRLRTALHMRGLRFRLHRKDLPGSPDIVFVRQKVAVFVDGCFWHGCPAHGARPQTNAEFWSEKIEKNRARDSRASRELKHLGWTVLRIWEHELKRDVAGVAGSVECAVRASRSDA